MGRCSCGLGEAPSAPPAVGAVPLTGKVKINRAQKLYVIPAGRGYTTMGFEYARKLTNGIANWVGDNSLYAPAKSGTAAAYNAYKKAAAAGREYADATRSKCPVELTPQLVGLEGKRVEVVDRDGEVRRFIVGKSTEWMPIHLEIKTRASSGGVGVMGAPFKSVRVV